jgi:hypothetical protein
MSHNKRHGTAEAQLRVIPRLPRLDRDHDREIDPDRTIVDRKRALPSVVAKPSTSVPNVIPFTKPRAIAAIAATNPRAVVIANPDSPRAPAPLPPAPSPSLPPAHAPPHASSYAPHSLPAPATRVATGWTPPGAVPIVKPPAPVAPTAQTIYPVTAPEPAPAAMPAPVMPLAPLPGTVNPSSAEPAPQPMFAPPPDRWAAFEALGLGAPKRDKTSAAKLVVSTYRALGFAILSIIVFVLVGYIASTAFFYVSDSWVVPMAVTATDEKIVSLQAQLADYQTSRDRVADELRQAERAIEVEQSFQLAFARAIRSDLQNRRNALERVRELASAAAATRRAIKHQNTAYAAASKKRMQQEYAAGLIDRSAMLSGKFQIAQISSSNLSLAERQAEFETRAAELEDHTRSLDAILSPQPGDAALSYEVLRIKQQFESSRLDLAREIEARDTLRASLARQDKIVASLRQSAYLRAIEDGAQVAFVPYGNLASIEPGASIYACRLGMIVCRDVGDVLAILPGEVQFKHPHRDRMLRGQLVELRFDDDEADAAADDVLFVGGKPLRF